MADNPAKQAELDQLQALYDQVEKILDKFQGNRLLDAETKVHQKNLERLLKETHKILEGKADKKDVKAFQTLITINEQSLRELKQNNKDNKRFEKVFVEQFGNDKLAGSIVEAVAKNLGLALKDIASSVNQAIQPAKKSAIDTGLSLFTGPFGKLFQENFNLAPFKRLWEEHKQHEAQKRNRLDTFYRSTNINLKEPSLPNILGQFDGGIDRVPQSGTYLLHHGERVIPPPQNQDLTRFLNNVSESQANATGPEVARVIKVFEQGHTRGYFDPIIDNDNRLFHLSELERTKFEKGLEKNFEVVEASLRGVGKETATHMLTSLQIWWKRFLRHPILNISSAIGRVILSPLTALWHAMFGRKKKDVDRVVKSNEDIITFLRTGLQMTKKTGFQRFARNILTLGGVSRAERTQKRVEREGYRHGFKGLLDSFILGLNSKYINRGKFNKEAIESKRQEESLSNLAETNFIREGFRLRAKQYREAGGGLAGFKAFFHKPLKEERRGEGKTRRTREGNVLYPDEFDRVGKHLLKFAEAVDKARAVLDRLVASMRARRQPRDEHGRFVKRKKTGTGGLFTDNLFSDEGPEITIKPKRRQRRDAHGRFMSGFVEEKTTYRRPKGSSNEKRAERNDRKKDRKYQKESLHEQRKATEHLKDIDKHTHGVFFNLLMGAGKIAGSLLSSLLGGAFGLGGLGLVWKGMKSLFKWTSELATYGLPKLLPKLKDFKKWVVDIGVKAKSVLKSVSGFLLRLLKSAVKGIPKSLLPGWLLEAGGGAAAAASAVGGLAGAAGAYLQGAEMDQMKRSAIIRMHKNHPELSMKALESVYDAIKSKHDRTARDTQRVVFDPRMRLAMTTGAASVSESESQRYIQENFRSLERMSLEARKPSRDLVPNTTKIIESMDVLSGKLDQLGENMKSGVSEAKNSFSNNLLEDLGTYLTLYGRS